MVVRNAGIDWGSPGNCYWQHKVARQEAARIVLHGQSEFEASHVVLEGNQDFTVGACPPTKVLLDVHCGANSVWMALWSVHLQGGLETCC